VAGRNLEVSPRLVIIDVPQVVDLASNPNAMEFLQRDCANMAHWFTSRGLPVDEGEAKTRGIAAKEAYSPRT
jgi:RIO kinase 1